MTKKLFFLFLLLISFSKAFSQGIFYYICNECYDSVEGGVSVLIPQKANPGVFIQHNTNLPIVDNLLEFKSSLGYSHFFSKLEGKYNGDEKSYSINKLGIMFNLDFLIKKKLSFRRVLMYQLILQNLMILMQG